MEGRATTSGGNDILFGGDDDDFMDGDADSTPSQYHGTDYLDGGAGNDTMFGSGGDDFLFGGTGNDNLYGDAIAGVQGDDYLDGGANDDILYGNDANDTLIGGTGNDTLYGGYGSDIHVYALGDGNDTLYDFHAASDSNTLRLGAGITLAGTKLAFRAQGYQLTFSDGGSIQLKGDYSYSVSSGGTYTITNAATKSDIQRVEFEDGTSMSWLQMVQRGFTQSSVAVAATVLGTNYNDMLSGGVNATLNGGLGSDTYLVDAGGGGGINAPGCAACPPPTRATHPASSGSHCRPLPRY